ncbi:hypothetical protein H8D64_01180 [PVC group bacterium]|nr:hypothetical protein [PVC group bacterium]
MDNIVAEYGHVIVDECYHISAFTFELVRRQIKAHYVTGLTATPIRKDGHHPIIFMQCGSIRWSISPKKAARPKADYFAPNGSRKKTDNSLPGGNEVSHLTAGGGA